MQSLLQDESEEEHLGLIPFHHNISLPSGFATCEGELYTGVLHCMDCLLPQESHGTQHPHLLPFGSYQPLKKLPCWEYIAYFRQMKVYGHQGAGGSFHLLCEFVYVLSLVRKKTTVSEQLWSCNNLNSATRVSETALCVKGNLVFRFI